MMQATLTKVSGQGKVDVGAAVAGHCLDIPRVGECFLLVFAEDDRYIRTSTVRSVVGPAEGLTAKPGVFHIFTRSGSHYRVTVTP